jgi:hypothetical protein
MEVNGQLHDLATLFSGEQHLLPTGLEAVSQRVILDRVTKRKIPTPLPEI